PIVDQFFLINPGDVDSLNRHIYDSAFKAMHPTYIAESPLLFGTMRGHSWLWRYYEFWSSYPPGRTIPLNSKQTQDLRKAGLIELDVWKLQTRPLPLSRAQKLAKDYVA